ncbi:MAG: GTPase ObgE [Candidatus Roizmanbacteria bacterium]|nr:GTPase ObgE [Candidatus Roizmanbacteria bacterium]
MLIDTAHITVKAGDGGDGRVSFRREKYIPKGGPDGGNGGKGGNVYIQGRNDIRLLKKYRAKTRIDADDGDNGQENKKTGKNGRDTTLLVPLGTRVIIHPYNIVLDIVEEEKPYRIASGGKGGKGNWEFRSATNQTPREAEKGRLGETVQLVFELRLIADIGLMGLPNVGKSSLLNVLTQAHARVADYHFTTLEPNLGTFQKYIIADIPGLIEGASNGKGLGFQFLKHISRTRLLVHCIACDSPDPKRDYDTVQRELQTYDIDLLERPQIILCTKSDLLPEMSNAQKKQFMKKIRSLASDVLFVSILDDESIDTLTQTLIEKLNSK